MALFDKEFIDTINSGDATNPAQIADKSSTIINKALTDFILPIAAFVILAFGIYGSVLYFTAYGSEEKATKGKMTILWAVVGAIVVAAAWLLVSWWAGSIAGQDIDLPGGSTIQSVTSF